MEQSRDLLTLDVARELVLVAIEQARRDGALVSVAVVDAGGHLVHFSRMDGAEIAGPTLATDKAFTATAHRIATDDLTELTAPGGPLWGLQANGAGRYVVFGGGVPLCANEGVVGAVGVSGGSVTQDVDCARAALRHWDACLTARPRHVNPSGVVAPPG